MDADWRCWQAVVGNFDFLVERLSTTMERAEELCQKMFAKSHLTFHEYLYILSARYPEEKIEKLLIFLLKRQTHFQNKYSDLKRKVDDDASARLANSLKQLEASMKPNPNRLFGLDLSALLQTHLEDITCEIGTDEMTEKIESGHHSIPIMFEDYGDHEHKLYHNDTFAIAFVSEDGGLLRLRDGSACLSVPAGAFRSYPQLIYMYTYHETFSVDVIEYSLQVVHCGPDGLSFDVPATLAFTHKYTGEGRVSAIHHREQSTKWERLDPKFSHFVTKNDTRFVLAIAKNTGDYTVFPSDFVPHALDSAAATPAIERYTPARPPYRNFATQTFNLPIVAPVSKPYLPTNCSESTDRSCYQLFHLKSKKLFHLKSKIKVLIGPLSAITDSEKRLEIWSTVSPPQSLPAVFSEVTLSFEAKRAENCKIKNCSIEKSANSSGVDEFTMDVGINNFLRQSSLDARVDLLIYAKTRDSPIYQLTLFFSGKISNRSARFSVQSSKGLKKVGYMCKSALLTHSMTSSLVIRSSITDIAYVPPLYRHLARSMGIGKETYDLICTDPDGHRDAQSRGMVALIEAYCGMSSHGDARHSIRELMCLAAVALPEPLLREFYLLTILRSLWKRINTVPAEDSKKLALLLLKNGEISIEDGHEIDSIENPILRMMWLVQSTLPSNCDSYKVFDDLFSYINTLMEQGAFVFSANSPGTHYMADKVSRQGLQSDHEGKTDSNNVEKINDALRRAVSGELTEIQHPAIRHILSNISDEIKKFQKRMSTNRNYPTKIYSGPNFGFLKNRKEKDEIEKRNDNDSAGGFVYRAHGLPDGKINMDPIPHKVTIPTGDVHNTVRGRPQQNWNRFEKIVNYWEGIVAARPPSYDDSSIRRENIIKEERRMSWELNERRQTIMAREQRDNNRTSAVVKIGEAPWKARISENEEKGKCEEKRESTGSGVQSYVVTKEIPESVEIVNRFGDECTILFGDKRSNKSNTSVLLPTLASAVIRSGTGGLVRLADDSVSIKIPRGAFKHREQRVDIFTKYENSHIGGVDCSVRIVQCQPDGMVFDKPICVSFRHFSDISIEFLCQHSIQILTRNRKTRKSWKKLDKRFYVIDIPLGLVAMHVMQFSEYMIVPLIRDQKKRDK